MQKQAAVARVGHIFTLLLVVSADHQSPRENERNRF
jgi:hypothetical protein